MTELRRINWDIIISNMVKTMRKEENWCVLQPFVPPFEFEFVKFQNEGRIWELAIYDKRKFKVVPK